MSLIRTYVQNLDPESLNDLWSESEFWESYGILPDDAKVREHVRLALPDVHEFITFTLMVDRLFAEVWRELYVRTDALYAAESDSHAETAAIMRRARARDAAEGM